ncbi:hypothetical protein ACFYOT_21840 [Saccharothrix saharensis]|uniref:RICIN domain-containing protein n=1 Tax=Saccharothrix saharensis TaxID=571190 RepID=UPI003696F871
MKYPFESSDDSGRVRKWSGTADLPEFGSLHDEVKEDDMRRQFARFAGSVAIALVAPATVVSAAPAEEVRSDTVCTLENRATGRILDTDIYGKVYGSQTSGGESQLWERVSGGDKWRNVRTSRFLTAESSTVYATWEDEDKYQEWYLAEREGPGYYLQNEGNGGYLAQVGYSEVTLLDDIDDEQTAWDLDCESVR